jgi:hypothetical protein
MVGITRRKVVLLQKLCESVLQKLLLAERIHADPADSNSSQISMYVYMGYLIDRMGCVTMFSGSGRNNTQPRSPASFAPAAASFGAGGAAQILG